MNSLYYQTINPSFREIPEDLFEPQLTPEAELESARLKRIREKVKKVPQERCAEEDEFILGKLPEEFKVIYSDIQVVDKYVEYSEYKSYLCWELHADFIAAPCPLCEREHNSPDFIVSVGNLSQKMHIKCLSRKR
jgi:hypothetical protein